MKAGHWIKNLLCLESKEVGLSLSPRSILKRLILRIDTSHRIRYEPILKYLRNIDLTNLTILEVGSGSLGMTRFVEKNIIGADLSFEGPKLPFLKPVKSSVTDLSFCDHTFDLTVSVDMLEHLPESLRAEAISEMLRTTKKWMIITFPCGETAIRWENYAWKFWKRQIEKCRKESKKQRMIRRGGFLDEHRQYTLPSAEAVTKMIEYSSPSSVKVEVVENHSVLLWYLMAISKTRYNMFVWLMILVFSYMLGPVLKKGRWLGNYRTFLIVEKIDPSFG